MTETIKVLSNILGKFWMPIDKAVSWFYNRYPWLDPYGLWDYLSEVKND